MKTTTAKKTGAKRWRVVTVGPMGKGKRVLKSPDGTIYQGTPGEVRAACLLPSERRALADALRLDWYLAGMSVKERRVLIQWRRQEVIMHHFCRLTPPGEMEAAALEIMTEAAARYVRQTVVEFEREQIRAGIDGVYDLAKSEMGRYELPMTRQELRAFEAVGGRVSDFCEALKLSEALHTKGGAER